MKSNYWRFFLVGWENYPSFFLFYFIIACYLHVCTHVNVCMCGGQRLTLDILFFPFLTYILDKPPMAPGVNLFGYSDWEKSHRDFPAASSPPAVVGIATGLELDLGLGIWVQALRHRSVPFKLIIMYYIQVLNFEELQKGVPGAWSRRSPTSANPWALSMNRVSRVFFLAQTEHFYEQWPLL